MHPLLFGDFHNSKSIFHQTYIIQNLCIHIRQYAYFLLYSSYILSWSTSDHFMNEWNASTHLDVEMFWREEKSLKFVVQHICF